MSASERRHRGVCLDGRNLTLACATGVATYAAAVAAGLGEVDHEAEILLGPPKFARARRWLRAAWPGAFEAEPLARAPDGFARAWRSPDAFRLAPTYFDLHGRLLALRSRTPPTLMHWTYPLPMTFQGTRNIYTVHDMIPLTHPDLTSIRSARFGRVARQVARHADHIVTVSDSARRDVLRLLGLPEDRVTTTYQPVAVPPGLADAKPPALQGHFLFCGTIEPRKNLGRMIAAHRASGAAAPLILAGPDGWRAAEELARGGVAVRPLDQRPPGAQGGVWRAPWLERPALLELMRGARALLFATLAEGFGRPILEAMTLGVPVLTSEGGATEEIAGGAALLADPLDTACLAAAIARLDRDAELRARLASAGRLRAASFAGEPMRRLAEVYARLGAAA